MQNSNQITFDIIYPGLLHLFLPMNTLCTQVKADLCDTINAFWLPVQLPASHHIRLQIRLQRHGAFSSITISDLDAIISYAEKDDRNQAVVVGGGLLGLEAAKAVYDLETCV
jgi:hypothetical protein